MDNELIITAPRRTNRRTRPPEPYELLARLDMRGMGLLQWLLRYPFQRAEDLALATGSSVATVYRHLNVLQENGLVERITPATLGIVKCHVYHLSNLGLHALAVHEQADPLALARAWRTDERGLLRLLPRVASLMTLQECINGLLIHAPEALAHQGSRSEVRWHWVRDYAHRFFYREKPLCCTADAALLLRVRPAAGKGTSGQVQWYGLFLLFDAEIAGDSVLKQRVGRLLCYRESAERWPVYQHFPPVLVLVSTSRRMEHWQWCAREAATALNVAKLSGAIACLAGEQQMASYNPWQLPWKTLGTNGQCTLREVLHPVPMEALPPGLWDQYPSDHVIPETSSRGDGGATAITSLTRKRTRVIVGTFMDRTNAVHKGHMNDRHDNREIIALLGLSLGKRHLDLLKFLFTYPLLHLHEMAALLERESSSIERYLRVLHRFGCIVPVLTEAGQRWRLCERGLHLIAATQHLNMYSIATLEENNEEVKLVQQRLEVLLRHLEHTAGIYGFFASLSQAASLEQLQGREHRLLWWETGSSCERRYRYQDRWHNLRPDACAAYQAGIHQVRFWLEWDRATMGTRDLIAKFRTYAHYVTSHEWFKEQQLMPYLLVVVPGKEQEMRIARIAAAVLEEAPGLVILTTTATRLADQGSLAAIWYQVTTKERSSGMVPRTQFYQGSKVI